MMNVEPTMANVAHTMVIVEPTLAVVTNTMVIVNTKRPNIYKTFGLYIRFDFRNYLIISIFLEIEVSL